MNEFKILIVTVEELEFLLKLLDMASGAGVIEPQQALDWIHNACSAERREHLRDLPQSI